MKQKEYRTVWITRHMRAGMLAAGLLLPWWPGRRRFSVVGMGWISGFCFGFVGQDFGCCNYLHDRGPAHRDGRY